MACARPPLSTTKKEPSGTTIFEGHQSYVVAMRNLNAIAAFAKVRASRRGVAARFVGFGWIQRPRWCGWSSSSCRALVRPTLATAAGRRGVAACDPPDPPADRVLLSRPGWLLLRRVAAGCRVSSRAPPGGGGQSKPKRTTTTTKQTQDGSGLLWLLAADGNMTSQGSPNASFGFDAKASRYYNPHTAVMLPGGDVRAALRRVEDSRPLGPLLFVVTAPRDPSW